MNCRECGHTMHPLMLQSVQELGVNAVLYRCDNVNWCGEFHMLLYRGDELVEAYCIDREEKEQYRRLARRHRVAAGKD